MKLVRPSVVPFSLLIAAFLVSCGGDSAADSGQSAASAERTAPAALSWDSVESGPHVPTLNIGSSAVDGDELRMALLDLHRSYKVWGACTLAWHLLDGGMGPSSLMHDRFAEQSAAAKQQADAAAKRLREGESYYSILQEVGGDPSPVMRQPSPSALGAQVAAAVAPLEPGSWAGPLRTLDGWTIALLEARAEGPRSRSGVVVREIVFPVGEDADRTQARADWATLPLAGDPALLRSLPRSFVRGRTPAPASLR